MPVLNFANPPAALVQHVECTVRWVHVHTHTHLCECQEDCFVVQFRMGLSSHFYSNSPGKPHCSQARGAFTDALPRQRGEQRTGNTCISSLRAFEVAHQIVGFYVGVQYTLMEKSLFSIKNRLCESLSLFQGLH